MQIHLKSLFTLSLSLAMGLSVISMAHANDETMWDSQRQMDAYYTPLNGLEQADLNIYEKAMATLSEGNFEGARELFEPLSQKYPDVLVLQLKLVETYLGEVNPEQAQELLQAIEAKILPEDERAAEDTQIYFQTRMLLAKSWMIQNEPEKGLSVLKENKYNGAHLSALQWSELHVFRAKAYQSLGKWIETQAELNFAKRYTPLSAEISVLLEKLAPQIAEAYYRKGLAAFRSYDFGKALPLAHEAHRLNLQSQAYLALYMESHERLQDETMRRFLKVRQPFAESLKKIRWALEVEDYAKARELYDQMLLNKDIAYLLEPVPRSMLPVFMQQTLSSLDISLKNDSLS